jgi:hypothetical protein
MGPPSYMRSVVDRNVVMRLISVLHFAAQISHGNSKAFLRKVSTILANAQNVSVGPNAGDTPSSNVRYST